MSELFAITDISLKCGLLLAVFAIAAEPIFRYLTLLLDYLRHFKHFVQKKRLERAKYELEKKQEKYLKLSKKS